MTGSCRPPRSSRRRPGFQSTLRSTCSRSAIRCSSRASSVSLAELAPGRVVFGVGIGGEDRHEIEVSGVDPATRGRRTDESLEILRGLLAGDAVTFHGACFEVDDVRILPVPSPAIPILVGGRSDAAVRRAARFADGWIGVWVSPERFATTAVVVEASSDAYGRESVAWCHELLVWCGFGDSRDARVRISRRRWSGSTASRSNASSARLHVARPTTSPRRCFPTSKPA